MKPTAQDSWKQSERIEIDFSGSPFHRHIRVGRYNYCRASAPLHAHRHIDYMEICYLAKGTQVYEVHGARHVLTGNDVYVTFPGEEHSSDGFPEDKGILYWVLVRLSDGPFLLFAPDQAKPLLDALRHLRRRSFRGTKVLGDLLDDLITAHYREPGPFTELIISTKVIEFLLEILHCARASTDTPPPDDVKTALDYIEGNLSQAVTVGELAELTGLSVSRFKAKFKEVVGIPPAEYILRRKIDLAKKLLVESDRSITSIAYSLDFSSSQYFATVFKRFMNQHPSEYRENSISCIGHKT